MNKIFIAIFFIMFFSIIKSLFRAIKVYLLLKRLTPSSSMPQKQNRKIKIIIPVYNEIDVIKESVDNFRYISTFHNVEVIYIAKKEQSNITTYQLLKKYTKNTSIKVIKYPFFSGVMAHQINYGCKFLHKNDVIWIHNVDSIPNIEVINFINTTFEDKYFYQQPSCYSILSKHKNIIKSAISWQNRWSIMYEIPKYTTNLNCYKYTIGHGAIFSKHLYDNFKGYPENEANEDNVLGFILSQLKIKIKLIPIFDEVGFTESKITYIQQQSIWFNGPLYAFSYLKNYLLCNKFKAFLLASQNYKAAVSWILWPLMSLIILLYSLVLKDYKFFFIIILLSIIYSYILNYISFIIIKKYLRSQKMSNIIYDYLYFFFRICGPLYSFYKILFNKNYGLKNKTKTNKTNNF